MSRPPKHLNEHDLPHAKRRWAAFLNAFVGLRKNERLLSIKQLDVFMKAPCEYADSSEYQIARHLREDSYPQSAMAWDIGIALLRAGIGYASGLLALYAASYFADFVGVLGRMFITRRAQNSDLWLSYPAMIELLLTARPLIGGTLVCADRICSEIYAGCSELDQSWESAILEECLDGYDTMPRDPSIATNVDLFQAGKRAQEFWTFDAARYEQSQKAWEGWKTHHTPAHPLSALREVLDAALMIVQDRSKPLGFREWFVSTALPYQLMDFVPESEQKRLKDLRRSIMWQTFSMGPLSDPLESVQHLMVEGADW